MNGSTSKGTSQVEAILSSEKIKPVSFAIVCSNFLKVFRIDLKSSSKEIVASLLRRPYYKLLLWFMIHRAEYSTWFFASH